jgi:MoaA/NifB/PqqE/SkfB family radical SAM enzyme
MGWKGVRALKKFHRRKQKGGFFPAFHFISVTDHCNLKCQGCWVTHKKENAQMEPGMLHSIINESKEKGSYFFGILGGEPLLYPKLDDVFKKHSDSYFQLFTNGTLLSSEVAKNLKKCANVSPLISFEGDKQVADVRRGGKNVYEKTLQAIENATQAGLITGVAMSVCKSNIDLALSHNFIQMLVDKKVSYLWYYVFRPVGAEANANLALSNEEILTLRKHMVAARRKYKLAIIDAYWDKDGKGLCPAASGLSHHINASGNIEPCPVIQFSKSKVGELPLGQLYATDVFLSYLRDQIPAQTNGCIIMDNPNWLAATVEKFQADDTSGRGNELERLIASPVVPSHGSIKEIPEDNFFYRIAKKYAFFGFGAYG